MFYNLAKCVPKIVRSGAVTFVMLLIGVPALAVDYCEGPSGGGGGGGFSDANQAPPGHMHAVNIRHGSYIDNIQAVAASATSLQPHGGGGGDPSVFSIDDSNDYLSSVTGNYSTFVNGIILTTAKGKTATYGTFVGGAGFEYLAPEGYEIVAFCGHSGIYVDAIGVVIRKLP